MIKGFIENDFLIYVTNFSEWVDIETYLINNGVFWFGLYPDKLFNKWELEELVFPRYLIINYISDESCWYMGNLENLDISEVLIDSGIYIKQASQFLRSEKLKVINLLLQ